MEEQTFICQRDVVDSILAAIGSGKKFQEIIASKSIETIVLRKILKLFNANLHSTKSN